MLVATAGHIDHGKTSLIRALTGVETDRLPEERARGISIDLGFAYWRPDGGRTIGFVDVPGHDRFIRNMLAGVSAADFALVVVAADDGVKPQTVEHVQILDLLDFKRAVVAITKCDRSSRNRVDAVRDEITALLAPTGIAGAPIFEVSSVTGAGVAELGNALRAVHDAEAPRAVGGRNFRLAVDRAFTVTGAGTVVTGTVLDGGLETGAHLIVSPKDIAVRVRGLQSAGLPVAQIEAGERCALNLAGVEVAQLHRGDWLVIPTMHAPTERLELRLKVLPSSGQPVRHTTPVHLHLGTADITGRVFTPRGGSISPGDESVVQLALDHPTSAITGERFVLRDQSGRLLIGGGRIVDPFIVGDRRKQVGRVPVSAALQRSGPAEALSALGTIVGYEIDTPQFERRFNLERASAQEIYRQSDFVLLGKSNTLALPANRITAINKQIVELLKDFHRTEPDIGGMTRRDLKAKLSAPLSADAFASVLKLLSEARIVDLSGSLVKLAGHVISFSAAENALWKKLQFWLEERSARPFTIRDLVDELRTGEAAIKAMLHRRRVNGDLWSVTDSRFLLREQVAALSARAAVLAKELGNGFTAAQYRDATGIGRNHVIPILEFLDRIGVTMRKGDLRVVQPDYDAIVGIAVPYVAVS